MSSSNDMELPKGLAHFKERDISWLWQQMTNNRFGLPFEYSVQRTDKASIITQHLHQSGRFDYWVNTFINMHNNTIPAFEHFKWIDKNDYRLLIWLDKRVSDAFIQDPNNINMPVPLPQTYEKIISIIYISPQLSAAKTALLHSIQTDWSQKKTPNTITKWVNHKDEIQLTWCWSYLLKHGKGVNIDAPINNNECYIAILSSLDLMSHGHPAEKQLFIERMKKTWSQKKYRDSENAKKQVSFAMNETIRDKLNAIAQKHDEKLYETLERLIKAEYKSISTN